MDEAIRPVADAVVVLNLDRPRETTSGGDGGFVFNDVPAGTHFLLVDHALYEPAQVAVEVPAGGEVPTVKVLLVRDVSESAYSQQVKFTGFIQCGFVVLGVSSICVNDYSTIVVPGGCCPELRDLVDNRGFVTEVGAGWSTIVFELVWEPSAQGTSEEMFILVSHTGRTAGDWFGEEGGMSPVLLRFESGEPHPSGGGDPAMIAPEGMDDIYAYGGVDGDTVAVGFSQEFEIIQTNFYGGKPPEGWSVAAGDEPPF